MSLLQERLRRLEDVEAIRRLDAVYCRLLDDGDRPALVELFTEDGVVDGLRRVRGHRDLLAFCGGPADAGMSVFWHHVSTHEIQVTGGAATVRSLLWQPCGIGGVPHVAAGRYADELASAGGGRRSRVERLRFSCWRTLTEGWDRHRCTLGSAPDAAIPQGESPA